MKYYLNSKHWKQPALLMCLLWSSCTLAGDLGDLKQRLAACESCHKHTDNAQQSYAPSISGKPVEYLYQQLLNYRDGRRLNSSMNTMLTYLSDDYLHEIASYYSELPETDFTGESDARKLSSAEAITGKELVHTGATGPACSTCHGSDLRGDGVAIPSLRGLSAKYIAAQLGAWRTGTRHALAPDCMKEVATMLTGDELNVVSQWIAHAFEEASTPQAIDVEMPLPCGALQ